MEFTFERIVTLVIIINIIAYWIKFILKSKGYTISWLYNHHHDFVNIWKLLGKTKKFSERVLYFVIGTVYPILIVIFIYAAFLQVSTNPNFDPCVYQEKFRQSDWNGIVVKKYIDQSKRSLKTIEIENEDGNLNKIQNWVLFQNGNYEKIELGDSIVKKQDLIFVSLYKSDTVIQLDVDYGCRN